MIGRTSWPALLLKLHSRSPHSGPVRQGLNLLSGDPLAAAIESFDYEHEDALCT